MADWWDSGQFNLGGDTNFDSSWWNVPDFNIDWGNFNFPDFNWAMPALPDFNFPDFNFNLPTDAFNFNFPDPLALPSFTGPEGFQPAFMQGAGGDIGQAPGMAGAPLTLSTALGLKGGGAAPNTTLPDVGATTQGSDPLTNLMASDQGQGMQWPGSDFTGPGLGQGSAYADPFSSQLDLGGYAGPGGAPQAGAGGQSLQEQVLQAQLDQLKNPKQPSTMDTIAKLAAAFGPTALGGAGLLMQGLNQPKRNPLEDDLLRAKIASSGLQDQLAKDRLDFEKQQAEANRAAQEAMQSELINSRRPGGVGNIQALLAANPQLAALYNALTKSGTNLASGSPEFEAQVDQLANVEITQLKQQADDQKKQAMEMSQRQGVNPAGIIAKIDQAYLQGVAKARATARQTLIQQMGASLAPGSQIANIFGSLFGNLFQTPSAEGA